MSELTRDEFSRLYIEAVKEAPALAAYADRWTDLAVTDRLWKISDRLIDNARRFNLTAILEPREIVRKHILDSMIPLAVLEDGGIRPRKVLDVGTGAGFPLLPWACVLPEDVKLTGLDATAKKISHIRESAEYAGLVSVSAVQGRAEEVARTKRRESYDLVTARAVASLPVLAELCAPFVSEGGVFAAFKSHAEEEAAAAAPAVKELGLTEIRSVRYAIPGGDTRTLLIYRKTGRTPGKYPRRYAEIINHPIV